jgi:hypothetical protein
MAAGNVQALLTALVSTPGHASAKSAAVRFLILPSSSFKEVSWVKVRPASSFFFLHWLTDTGKIYRDGQEVALIIVTIASRIFTRSFFISSGKLGTTWMTSYWASDPCEELHELF